MPPGTLRNFQFRIIRSTAAGFCAQAAGPRRLNAAASSANRLLKLCLSPVLAKAAYEATGIICLFLHVMRHVLNQPYQHPPDLHP
jgi:hypothetical protein